MGIFKGINAHMDWNKIAVYGSKLFLIFCKKILYLFKNGKMGTDPIARQSIPDSYGLILELSYTGWYLPLYGRRGIVLSSSVRRISQI